MVVCVRVYSVFVLPSVQAEAFRRADHSSKDSYCLCVKKKRKKNKKLKRPGPNKRAVEPLLNECALKTSDGLSVIASASRAMTYINKVS
jgi:hypothetical protein